MIILLHADRIFYASTGSLNRSRIKQRRLSLIRYIVYMFSRLALLISPAFQVWLFDLVASFLIFLKADFCLILKFSPQPALAVLP